MNHNVPSPRQFGIPHDSWRPGQYEAARAIHKSKKRFTIASAPTGSGKTSIGSFLGHRESVRVLTSTRALQDQYRGYGFDVLYGMNAYECAFNPIFTADLCAYITKMHSCPKSSECQYLIQREKTKESQRQCVSYAYQLAATWTDLVIPEWMYLDEAHLIHDIIESRVSVDLDGSFCRKLGIPHYKVPPGKSKLQSVQRAFAIRFFDTFLEYATSELERLDDRGEWITDGEVKLKKALANTSRHFETVLNALLDEPDSFYIDITAERFKVTALSARPFFKPMFEAFPKLVLTSATIGSPSTFANGLGIGAHEYEFINTPSNFSPQQMPVYQFTSAPRMSHSSGSSAKAKWINIIYGILDERRKKHALVHAASIRDGKFIATQLENRGINVHVPDERLPTSLKEKKWREALKKANAKGNGLVTVSWSFWAGIDAPEVDVNIITKVPFAALDDAGRAKMKLDPNMYKWRAANQIEQAAGRIRRGDPSHYEQPGGQERKFVAVVDSNINMVKKYMGDHFRSCIRKV